MKLFALSDLHLSYQTNREALYSIENHPDDWLILAGDIGESQELLKFGLNIVTTRFKKVIWVPGNHDLWTMPQHKNELRGKKKYDKLVQICRDLGVITPEDPYIAWPDENGNFMLVPMFLLYDYSFRPVDVSENRAVQWAIESGIVCADEELLHSDPYPSFSSWCTYRWRYTEKRLKEIPRKYSLILINHFPLKKELTYLEKFSRFSIWCGTSRTENWHKVFNVSVVVYGHMHIRSTKIIDNVRFEEVSLGYPHNWNRKNGVEAYMRKILPESDFYCAA